MKSFTIEILKFDFKVLIFKFHIQILLAPKGVRSE